MRLATDDGTYPTVFNNNLVDGSFGITSKIVLDKLTPVRWRINSIEVPNSSQSGVPPNKRSDGQQLFVQIGSGAQFVDRP